MALGEGRGRILASVGSVENIELTDDGRAELTLSIDADGYEPLRTGTRADVSSRDETLSGLVRNLASGG